MSLSGEGSENMDWLEDAEKIDAELKLKQEEQERLEEIKKRKEEEKKAREQKRIDINMTDEEREQYLIKQREQHNKELAEHFLSDSSENSADLDFDVKDGTQRNYDLEDAFFGGDYIQPEQNEDEQNKELKTEQDYKDFGKKLGQMFAKTYHNNHDEYYQQLEQIVLECTQQLDTQDIKGLCDFCFQKLSRELSRRK